MEIFQIDVCVMIITLIGAYNEVFHMCDLTIHNDAYTFQMHWTGKADFRFGNTLHIRKACQFQSICVQQFTCFRFIQLTIASHKKRNDFFSIYLVKQCFDKIFWFFVKERGDFFDRFCIWRLYHL